MLLMLLIAGIHKDHVYVDIRRAEPDNLDQYVEVFNVDGDAQVFKEITKVKDLILTGILQSL